MANKTFKVLITGANSYIGTTFEKWAANNCWEIATDTLDMLNEDWKNFDFSPYDSIFHVAGIAHADVGKVTEEGKKLYYKVNADLAVETAKKAKEAGVKQFIYMSSIIVYGDSAGIGKKKVISRDTPVSPANFYGDSKVKGEEGLKELESDTFKIVCIRPPMIYGKGSKGNYPLLAKLALKAPIFPKIDNQRSMLYVGNLCKFISLMILNEESGVFYPQNDEYVTTSKLVELIAKNHNKNISFTSFFNPVLKAIGGGSGKLSKIVNKAFGSLTYEMEMSDYKDDYRMYSLEESIRLTEAE